MKGDAKGGQVGQILEHYPDAEAVEAHVQALYAIDRDEALRVSHEKDLIKREVLK